MSYSTVYYLVPLNFSLIVQLTRKFYICELSRAPPRAPRRGGAGNWILGERSQVAIHGSIRGTVGLHEETRSTWYYHRPHSSSLSSLSLLLLLLSIDKNKSTIATRRKWNKWKNRLGFWSTWRMYSANIGLLCLLLLYFCWLTLLVRTERSARIILYSETAGSTRQ